MAGLFKTINKVNEVKEIDYIENIDKEEELKKSLIEEGKAEDN